MLIRIKIFLLLKHFGEFINKFLMLKDKICHKMNAIELVQSTIIQSKHTEQKTFNKTKTNNK